MVDMSLQIKEQLVSKNHPNRPTSQNMPIAVIIHYTANDSPSATDTANANYINRTYKLINGSYYESDGKTNFRYGSAQWFIDEDSATRTIPQNEVAWGCGDRQLSYDNGYKGQTKIAKEIFDHKQNYKTINYELCNNGDWKKACDNSIDIIAQDMVDFDISTDMIFRHYDITGKICPKPFVDDINAWNEYKNKIIKRVGELKMEKKLIKFDILGNKTEIEGIFTEGRNYVGARELLEKIGFKIDWDSQNQEIIVKFELK